jgi:hypothetical protein
LRQRRAALSGVRRFIEDYFWFILKNVVGWIFIVAAPVLGLTLPGPGGIPLFVIGFALVTFPGKRRLTSHVIRGRPIEVEPVFFTFLVTLISILITAGLLFFVKQRYEELLDRLHINFLNVPELLGICALAAGVTWLVMRLALTVLNFVLRRIPMIRRKIRPWLRKKGINLLPPRRTQGPRPGLTLERPADEIIEFDAKYQRGLSTVWTVLRIWLRRLFGVAITVLIFWGILRPIVKNWNEPEVQRRLHELRVSDFLLAASMFAVFLFVFRAMAWRHILARLGHKLPVAAATRIWSLSELARYLPGAVFQVVGRVYLIKPYGVRGSVTSVSQILELTIFLLANILLGVACLLYFGVKNLHGPARTWMSIAMGMIPVLLLLLHPNVCYGIINRVLRRLNKPPIANPLSGRKMLGILAWNMIGLLWQSLAVYVLTHNVLGFKLAWWWMVAGAYCLAWCAGFLAFWAPGGIGVRELVFTGALLVALPPSVQAQFGNKTEQAAILAFLSILLRLWATTGELIVAALANLTDLRGAMNDPTAPGRIPITTDPKWGDPKPAATVAPKVESPRAAPSGSTSGVIPRSTAP